MTIPAFDPAVTEMSHLLSASSHIVFMRDEHQRDALFVQRIKQIQHVVRGARVEGPRRFVCQQESGLVDDGSYNGHPLLLAA